MVVPILIPGLADDGRNAARGLPCSVASYATGADSPGLGPFKMRCTRGLKEANSTGVDDACDEVALPSLPRGAAKLMLAWFICFDFFFQRFFFIPFFSKKIC